MYACIRIYICEYFECINVCIRVCFIPRVSFRYFAMPYRHKKSFLFFSFFSLEMSGLLRVERLCTFLTHISSSSCGHHSQDQLLVTRNFLSVSIPYILMLCACNFGTCKPIVIQKYVSFLFMRCVIRDINMCFVFM